MRRIRYWFCLAIFLTLASGTSAAQTRIAHDWGYVDGPMTSVSGVWDKWPSQTDLAAAYPKQAHGLGVVKLRCQVDDEGALHECVSDGEFPAGHGFATAALSLTPQLRADPKAMFFSAGSPHRVRFDIFLSRPGESNEIPWAYCVPPSCLWETWHFPPTPKAK